MASDLCGVTRLPLTCAILELFPVLCNSQYHPLRLLITITPVIRMRNKDSGFHLSNGIASTWKSQTCTQFFLVPKSAPCPSAALMPMDPHDSEAESHCRLQARCSLHFTVPRAWASDCYFLPSKLPQAFGSPAPPPCPTTANPWVQKRQEALSDGSLACHVSGPQTLGYWRMLCLPRLPRCDRTQALFSHRFLIE